MGTTWSVKAALPADADPERLRAAIQQELDDVVALFSHWDPTSELSRFNAAPPGVWALSEPFWSFLNEALDLAADTGGGCDPTLGALVDLWGFGPPGPRPADAPLPTDDEIAAALEGAGRLKLLLKTEARAAWQTGAVRLDFSATAKGHAVDRVSERLTREGATSHLVEIGGELRGAGVKPDGRPWWVELESPPGGTAPRTLAALYDIAVATSGDYRRAFTRDGIVYPHTLDAVTGRPVRNGVASVTVFHERALYADAYATGITVMGPYEGLDFAESFGLAALVVERTPYGLVERPSPAWTAMLGEAA